MTTDKLWHSAQQLDNISPDLIFKGKEKLDTSKNNDKTEREKIISKINEIISGAKKLCKPPNVTIYYRYTKEKSDFVIKTVPNERDSFNRIAPILSYGNFPDETENDNVNKDWIKKVIDEIKDFTNSIERTINEETLINIANALKEVRENLQKKRLQRELAKKLLNLCLVATVILAPLILERIIEKPVIQIIQQEVAQKNQQLTINQAAQLKTQSTISHNQQPLTPVLLEKVIQKLMREISKLIAINNALLLILLKISVSSLLNSQYRTIKSR